MCTLTLCKNNRFKQRTNLLSDALRCMVFWWQQIYRLIRAFTESPHKRYSETLIFSELSFKSTTKVYSIYSKPSARWGKSMKALKATGDIQVKLAEMMFISWWKVVLKWGLAYEQPQLVFGVWWSLCEERSNSTCLSFLPLKKKVWNSRIVPVLGCLLFCKSPVQCSQRQEN